MIPCRCSLRQHTMISTRRKIDSRWSWLVCATACWANGLVNAVVHSYGVLLPVLMTEFSESRKRTALVGSLAIACACFTGFLGGRLSDYLGCQRTLVIGFLTCAVSLLISSWATGTLYLYFSYGILYGLGQSSIYMPCFLILCKYFKKWRALAMGIASAGAGAGVFVMGPSLQIMVELVGWRNAYRILAGIFVMSSITAYSFDSNVEGEIIGDHSEIEQPAAVGAASEPRPAVKRRCINFSVLRKPAFTVYLISMTLASFGHFSPSIHLVRYCEELGFSGREASYLYICIGSCSVIARVVVGRICDLRRLNPLRIAQAAFLCSALVTVLLTLRLGYVFLVVLSLFYGFADGAFVITFNVLSLNTVSPEQRSHAYGFVNFGMAVSVASGPPITGLIADRSSYVLAFYVSAAVTLAGALLPFVLLFFRNGRSHDRHVRSQLYVSEASTEEQIEMITTV